MKRKVTKHKVTKSRNTKSQDTNRDDRYRAAWYLLPIGFLPIGLAWGTEVTSQVTPDQTIYQFSAWTTIMWTLLLIGVVTAEVVLMTFVKVEEGWVLAALTVSLATLLVLPCWGNNARARVTADFVCVKGGDVNEQGLRFDQLTRLAVVSSSSRKGGTTYYLRGHLKGGGFMDIKLTEVLQAALPEITSKARAHGVIVDTSRM